MATASIQRIYDGRVDRWSEGLTKEEDVKKICSSDRGYKRPSSIIIDFELDYVVLPKLAAQTFHILPQAIAHKVCS